MDRQNPYLLQLRELVNEFLKDEEVKVVLFGSRSRGKASAGSDVDLGILPKETFSATKLSVLRDRLEESLIPYKVDLVNLAEVSEAFKLEILKEAVVWKDFGNC